MVRIGILGRPKEWESRQVHEAAKKAGHEAFWIDWTKLGLVLGVDGTRSEVREAEKADVILFRLHKIRKYEIFGRAVPAEDDASLAIAACFEQMGIPVINCAESVSISQSKYYARLLTMKAGLPAPLTCYAYDAETALRLLDEVIGYPAVIKPIAGSWGKGITKVHNRAEAEQDLKMRESFPVIIEEYVEKVGNRDIRVFVIGDEAVAAMYRIAREGTFITNVHRGGRVKGLETIPEDLAEMSVKGAKAVGLGYAGMDFMEDPQRGYLFIETNSVPGFWGLMHATGKNMAPKIVEYLVKVAKGEIEPPKPRIHHQPERVLRLP